jgi:hypothetical protein
MLIELGVLISYEPYKKNKNVDKFSYEKFTKLKLSKVLRMNNGMWVGEFGENAFSARQKAFLIHQQNLLTD